MSLIMKVKVKQILESFCYTALWIGITVTLFWMILGAINRHMEIAEAKGLHRLRSPEVKQRMRYHGTNAAHLGDNGTWYFKDKGGRLRRL